MANLKIEIKKAKSMPGRDGIAWYCDLWIGGAIAANVRDDGHGGEIDFRWIDRRHMAAFNAWAATLPPTFGDAPCNGGYAVARMMDEADARRRLARSCKKKTLFRLPDDSPDSVRTFPGLPTDAMRAHIAKKYPTAIIINDLIDKGLPLPGDVAMEIPAELIAKVAAAS